jgi:hypothetical protein
MRCSHWPRNGARCEAEATHWIYAPDGAPVPGCYVCEEHGTIAANEYREKLQEEWRLVPLEEHARLGACKLS